MEFEKNEELLQLYEFYKNLLTKKQQQYFEEYFYDDFSLAEIAENTNVSRQAVYDNLKRTKKVIENYEDELKLHTNYQKISQELTEALNVVSEHGKIDKVKEHLLNIQKVIEEN